MSDHPQQFTHDNPPLTECDFVPHAGDLDAQNAWRHFGGLSVTEALAKFREDPLTYQEDFMFMGGGAFAFYFPVLDTYLREYKLVEDDDESWAAIIGCGIALQLAWPTADLLAPLKGAIRSLADYVIAHVEVLAVDADERSRIAREWQTVRAASESRDAIRPGGFSGRD